MLKRLGFIGIGLWILFSVAIVITPTLSIWLKVLIANGLLLMYFLYVYNRVFKYAKAKRASEKSLKGEIAKINAEAEVASGQVSAVSEELGLELNDSNAFAAKMFEEITELNMLNTNMKNAMDTTIEIIKNMMALIDEGKQTSIQLGHIGSKSKEDVEESLKDILEIVKVIRGIGQSSKATVDNMERLNKTSTEIVQILEVVRNISRQTHLLALNASIESARAGEAGKGFAVVADEIRALSSSTEDAVKNINELIKTIQEEVSSVDQAVTSGTVLVEQGVNSMGLIENKLGGINSSFVQVNEMIESIMELHHREVELTGDIKRNIDNVESFISNSEESVKNVYENSHQQKHSFEDLSKLVDHLNSAATGMKQLFVYFDDKDDSEFDHKEKEELLESEKRLNEAVSNAFKLIENEVLTSGIIEDSNGQQHFMHLNDIIKSHPELEAIWTNEVNGRFICSIPEAGIANAKVREWFQKSIHGEKFVSKPYFSAISKNKCVTVSMPIKNKAGEIIGVVGLDVKG